MLAFYRLYGSAIPLSLKMARVCCHGTIKPTLPIFSGCYLRYIAVFSDGILYWSLSIKTQELPLPIA
jgi:hypothetical protein